MARNAFIIINIILITIGIKFLTIDIIFFTNQQKITQKLKSIDSVLKTHQQKIKNLETELKFKEINNYIELYDFLIFNKVSYPERWVAVSILESGWNWESEFATRYNNIFGFNYSSFNSKKECVLYLIKWINENPPYKDETGENYMKRRNYNPYINIYYPKLNQVISQINVTLHTN